MKIQKRIVMCRPEFFDVKYIINPWMRNNINKVNKELSIKQWENLKSILLSKKIFVKEIKNSPNCPDMVFTANHGIRIKNNFVVANFRFPERRLEKKFAIPQILKKEKLKRISCPYFWEGEAELFHLKKDIYIGGYGKRGTIEALKWFEKEFNIEIIPLEIKDNKFYHLDSCLTIRNESVYLFPKAFTKKSLSELIKKIGKKSIFFISKNAAENFGANCIQLPDCVIVGTKDKKTIMELRDLFKTKVISIDMSEFMKSGGFCFLL